MSNLTAIAGDVNILNNNTLTDLDGLSNLSFINGYLYILNNNDLIHLDGLSNIDAIGGYLNIYNNAALTNLNGLSNVTSIDGYLIISENDTLTDIDAFSNLSFISGYLNITNNLALADINGLLNLDTIGENLIITNNPVLTNLDGLSNLNSVGGVLSIYNNPVLTNIDGLSNLSFINGYLNINNNLALADINGLSNLNTVSGDLRMESNYSLINCCGIQAILASPGAIGGEIIISDNPSECSSEAEIIISDCDNLFAKGNVYFDSNDDGCDTADVVFPFPKFQLRHNNLYNYIFSNVLGEYRHLADSGQYVLLPQLDEDLFAVSPDSLILNLPQDSLMLENDFCVTAIREFNDLEITIIPQRSPRPGFSSDYKIIFRNKGSEIMDGRIVYEYDEELMTLISAAPPVDSSYLNTLIWDFTDLQWFEERSVDIELRINGPQDYPPVIGGEQLATLVSIYPIGDDEQPMDNTFALQELVVNSFDPNDKTCLNGNILSPDNVGEYLDYLIRFENQGSASAVHIKVLDTINTAMFDLHTLDITASSHHCFTTINDNVVEFYFKDIFLPFDDENNDGYVAFKIKTRDDLSVGDSVLNFADIYFDFNAVVRTNTATTEINHLTSQVFTASTPVLHVYPIPAHDKIYIQQERSGSFHLRLIDMQGLQVRSERHSFEESVGQVDISNLTAGMYFIHIADDSGAHYMAKFIKT